MTTPNLFDEINTRLSELFANTPVGDIEKNMRAMVAGALSKLDVVTREEFEVQQDILAKTRERLEALEARVAALEAEDTAAKSGGAE